MSIDRQLRHFVLSQPTVLSLISTSGVARYYALMLPASPAFPSVTYQVVDEPRRNRPQQGSPRKMPRVQLTAWGNSYGEARGVADALVDVLDGYHGWMGDLTNRVWVGSVQVDSERTQQDPTSKLYQAMVDLLIDY